MERRKKNWTQHFLQGKSRILLENVPLCDRATTIWHLTNERSMLMHRAHTCTAGTKQRGDRGGYKRVRTYPSDMEPFNIFSNESAVQESSPSWQAKNYTAVMNNIYPFHIFNHP